MNWLGELVQKETDPQDSVISIGCGVLQEIIGLDCRSFFGIDIYQPYVDKLKSQGIDVICADVTKYEFVDKYDIVLALDVLEHLNKEDAISLINKMKSIANKKVIVYTPSHFFDNVNINGLGKEQDINSWLENSEASPYKNMGVNKYQEHLCLITEQELQSMGFSTSTDNPDHNTFAIWYK